MSDDERLDLEEKCLRQVSTAKAQLLYDPRGPGAFFAHISMRMGINIDWRIPTFATDGRILLVNPSYCVGLDPTDKTDLRGMAKADMHRKAILVHEILHVALKHPFRRQGRDPMRWNIACFVAGTGVLLPDGTSKPIELVKTGDVVVGFDRGQMVRTVVTGVASRVETDLRCVLSEEGGVICTPDHPFLGASGYVEARDIAQPGRTHGEVLRAREGVCRQALPLHAGQGHSEGAGSDLPLAAWLPRQVESENADGQEKEWLGLAEYEREGDLVLCRLGGRRGHSIRAHQEREIHPAHAGDIQHVGGTSDVDGGEGLLYLQDYQRQKPAVLAMLYHGVLDLRATRKAGTPSHRQERVYGDFDSHHKSQKLAAASVQAFGRDGGGYRTVAGASVARAALSTPRLGRVTVYDVSTTARSFVANGFLVHNCDLSINPMVTEAGLELPPGCYVPGEGPFSSFKPGLSAVQYYDLLEELVVPSPMAMPGATLDAGTGTGEAVSEVEQTMIENEAESIVASAKASVGKGRVPASIERAITESSEPVIDWRRELAEFVSRSARNDYTWAKPSRRLASQGFVAPGLHSQEIDDIVIAVDTSGSIDGKTLDQFAAEVNGILSSYSCQVHVVYHDHAVAGVQEHHSRDGDLEMKPKGGGGTSHVPVFDWVNRLPSTPACVVCLTDMESVFPKDYPDYPVLWVVKGRCKANPGFGRQIRIGD